MKKAILVWALIVILGVIGWAKSIYKAVKCNWEPVGKAEVLYTAGAIIPVAGAFIGYFDIEDK
jgi:hypothetical protein